MSTSLATLSLPDARAAAFCSSGAATVFRPVSYPTEVWYPDPLDVERIHAPARELFDRLVDQAREPGNERTKVGRILLLKGESGSGKTHLMRAFRTRVHGQGLAYFGYMQMTSASGNYSRYMLHKLVDSLDKPYYHDPADPEETTGLMRLSTAVAEMLDRNDREFLRNGDHTGTQRREVVFDMADSVLDDPRFGRIDVNLLRAMLYLQCGNAPITSIIARYLRGESLVSLDQERLGLAPLDREQDAETMLHRLGQLMWAAQTAPLVLCIDQLEDVFDFEESKDKFRRAMHGVVSLAAHVPSSLVVIACLEDYYVKLRDLLDRPDRDRIETDPPPLSLTANRTAEEVAELLRRHLQHLFDEAEVSFDDAEPSYPLPQRLVENLAGQRTRSVLESCQRYRQPCIEAGRIVEYLPGSARSSDGDSTAIDETVWDQLWNDRQAADDLTIPDTEAELAALLESAVHFCADELGTGFRFDVERNGSLLFVAGETGGNGDASRLQIGICNKDARGGGLSRQVSEVDDLSRQHVPEAVPVIVRSTDFPKSRGSQISEQLGQLVASGGRRVVIGDSDWRAVLAMQAIRDEHAGRDGFDAWLGKARPLSQLRSFREIIGLKDLCETVDRPRDSSVIDATTAKPVMTMERPAEKASAGIQRGLIRLGSTRERSPRDVCVEPIRFARHAAFLGGTGSGKSTAALSVIEQLLIDGVPAILVDRKGDLARYAAPSVWEEPVSSPELAARQRNLRSRVEVALYTPGRSNGRPLALSVAPNRLGEMHEADRQLTARQAARSLGNMLGYGTTGRNASRVSIMVKAIELLAEGGESRITLDTLIEYVAERDPALINAIGNLPVSLFEQLVQDLETLKINRTHLFPNEGEPLDADVFFGVPRGGSDRTRLTVISTKLLGGRDEVQFWVAQLLLELGRWMSRNPSDRLQAVVLLDEADLYLPATSKPATKEPLENLLKRARSAGLGVFLATQSPGDLDYKCRENINTWFLGKIKEQTAIAKLKPMLAECRTDVAAKLPSQEVGEFFVIRGGDVEAVRCDRNVVDTRQLPEDEILALAAGNRP
ncbi:MAG: AAA family ATPase [Planctomycetaceae bacterium]